MSKLESHSTGIGDYPALVVVDMCKAFIDSSSPLGFECYDLIEANINLVNKFRLNKYPVIFTTTIYRDLSEASVFRSKIPALNMLEPESDAVTFIDDLAPSKDEILIEKKFASAFFQTKLIDSLLNIQADSVVICGVTTSGCVRATAVDSLQNNFPTIIAQDCVGDRDLDAHKANLYDLQAKYADVIHSNLIT
ncbi:isochorismatase family protein [Gammaproteobacteria bacterium]|nr:isochorismatase family protein [Gammaproteobacteria bacterium]MDC1131615.1 isochorismatase family protein [Gammaproteobacteria bacterium]